jgi:hypothetical protein
MTPSVARARALDVGWDESMQENFAEKRGLAMWHMAGPTGIEPATLIYRLNFTMNKNSNNYFRIMPQKSHI